MSSSRTTGTESGSAAAVRRAAALGVDLMLGLVLAGLLTSSTGHWLSLRAVDALATDDPAGGWKGPLPMVIGMVGSLVYGMPLAVILVTLGELLFAQSVGKALFGLRVVGARPSGRALRLILRDAPWWLALGALLVGAPAFTKLAACLAAVWAVGALVTLAVRGRLLHALPATTGDVARRGADQRA